VVLALTQLKVSPRTKIPSFVKLPNVKKLDVAGAPRPCIVELACSFTKLVSIELRYLNYTDTEIILKALGHNLESVIIDSNDYDHANLKLDLMQIFQFCPNVEIVRLSGIPLNNLDLAMMKKGLHSLRQFSLYILHESSFFSNGLLMSLMCPDSFPQLNALDLYGVNATDAEYHQITVDLVSGVGSGRSFTMFKVRSKRDENRESYLTFIKQVVLSFNIAPDGLVLPSYVRKLQKIEKICKKYEISFS
jgi:hypothetical protein